MEFHLDDFKKTKQDLRKVINQTHLQHSSTFGGMAGCLLYLKPECLQKNGSFKIRGAFMALNSLSPEQKKRGVITSSGGNWAQGVAYGCQLLGIKSLIVMPEHVSRIKLQATKSYGAEVLLFGSTSLELYQKVRELSEERGMTWIHAFNEPKVSSLRSTLLGYGSIGLEILEEQADIDVIVVPVGGGALISGISLAAKLIRPEVRLIGVQAEGAAAMFASLKKGKLVEVDHPKTIADGLAVKRAGDKTFPIVREHVEEIVLVTDDEIRSAILLLLERAKLLVEPSGAAPLAAVLNRKIKGLTASTKVAVVLSGGNIDLNLLRQFIG